MKDFTTTEVRNLLNQVMREDISFSEMVEEINQRVSEAEVSEYKDGYFVVNMDGHILIFKKKVGDRIYDHAFFNNVSGLSITQLITSDSPIRIHATEEEKQILLDALAKEGKRWNAEKLCVEDIPARKFKSGDKVRVKEGISSKTHNNIDPEFVKGMDDLIGKTMTVDSYTYDYVTCEGNRYTFSEEWLEPYVEELKKGDLAIFWDDDKGSAFVGKYNGLLGNGLSFPHQDHRGNVWANAIKFESKEQYERLIKGEK